MEIVSSIKRVLVNHTGRANAITAKEISEALKIHDNDSCSRTRALILETVKKHNLPLAADSRGYYLIDTKEEYIKYMRSLEHRISEIEGRKEIITENYFKNCDL